MPYPKYKCDCKDCKRALNDKFDRIAFMIELDADFTHSVEQTIRTTVIGDTSTYAKLASAIAHDDDDGA